MGNWWSTDPRLTPEACAAALEGRQAREAVVFECVGAPGVLQSLIEGAPPGAHIVVLGACMEEDAIVPVIAINKQLRLTFAFAYTPREFKETLFALADGLVDAELFLTGAVGLSEAPAAFEALARPERHVKIAVEPWRP